MMQPDMTSTGSSGGGRGGSTGGFSGGGRIGGTVVASRGSSAIGSARGPEGGSFSTGFSSRSLAQFGKGEKIGAGKVPAFLISKEGTITQRAGRTETGNHVPRQRESQTKKFGQKIEASNRFSADTRYPNPSSIKNMQPIFISKAADARYHSQPGHAKIHTGPEVVADTAKPKGEKPMQQVIRRNEQPTRKSDHPVYAQTRDLRIGEPHRQSQTHDSQRSLYDKRSNLNPAIDRLTISQNGEIKQARGTVDSSKSWKTMMAERQHGRPASTQVNHEAVHVATKRAVEKNSSNPQLPDLSGKPKVQEAVRMTQQHAFEQMLRTSRPIDLRSSQTIEQQLSHAVVKPRSIETGKTADQRVHEGTRGSVKHPVTMTETQRVLDTYVQYISHQTGQDVTKAPSVRITDIRNPQFQADIQQAARVMQAYQEAYPDVSFDAKKLSVTKALDQSLEKTHLKEQVMPELHIGTLESETEQRTDLQRGVVTISEENADVAPQTQVVTLTETETLPQLEEEQQTATISEPEVMTELMMEEEQATDRRTAVQTQTTPQGVQATKQQAQPELTEEELTEEEERLEELRLRLEEEYERDQDLDQFREDVALAIAEQAADTQAESVISGDVFIQAMSEPKLYEQMASEIAPGPDEYLTEYIEDLSRYNYRSVGEVKSKIAELRATKPAIRFSQRPEMPEDKVRYVRNSVRYPRII